MAQECAGEKNQDAAVDGQRPCYNVDPYAYLAVLTTAIDHPGPQESDGEIVGDFSLLDHSPRLSNYGVRF